MIECTIAFDGRRIHLTVPRARVLLTTPTGTWIVCPVCGHRFLVELAPTVSCEWCARTLEVVA